MRENDTELYRLIEKRDKQALEQLYVRYEKLLFSFVYKMTGQTELAEEVIQEVFIKLWTKMGIYDSTKGKFSSWLMTMTRNTCIDLLRKKKITTYAGDEELLSIENNDPSIEDVMEWKEKNTALKVAIKELGEDQQKVIDLFYFKAMSQTTIAQECNIPLGTVKGRIRLALQHLRKTLSKNQKKGVARDE